MCVYVGVFVCVYVCLYGPSPHGEVIRRRLSGTSTLFICTVFVLLFSDTAEGFSYAFLFFFLFYSHLQCPTFSFFFFHAPSFSCFYRLCSVHSRSLSFFLNLFSKRFFFLLVVVAVSSRLSRLPFFFFVDFVCVCVWCVLEREFRASSSDKACETYKCRNMSALSFVSLPLFFFFRYFFFLLLLFFFF